MPVVDHLMTPGPTAVPAEVLEVLGLPMLHHRTSEFRAIAKQLNDDLAYLYGAAEPPCTVVGSGTAAMEAAIVTVLGHLRGGDGKVLCLSAGKFGERWVDVCKCYGIATDVLEVEYGQAPTFEQVRTRLDGDKSIRAIILVHSETSTATVTDLEPISALCCERNVLVLVDGITSVGAFEVEMDKWGLDVLVTGSQKALMNPPGLGFAALSERAWAAAEKLGQPGGAYYLDLRAYRKKLADGDSPYTAAVSLVRGVAKACQMIRAKGREQLWADTAAQARAMRAAAAPLGMSLFSSSPADSVTALCVPESVDEDKLRKDLIANHSVQLAGGQGTMKGRIVRVSHMGAATMDDQVAVIKALAAELAAQGAKASEEEALAAAQEAAAQA
jgi:aspartate aminotransferase-like enzyme